MLLTLIAFPNEANLSCIVDSRETVHLCQFPLGGTFEEQQARIVFEPLETIAELVLSLRPDQVSVVRVENHVFGPSCLPIEVAIAERQVRERVNLVVGEVPLEVSEQLGVSSDYGPARGVASQHVAALSGRVVPECRTCHQLFLEEQTELHGAGREPLNMVFVQESSGNVCCDFSHNALPRHALGLAAKTENGQDVSLHHLLPLRPVVFPDV